MGGHLGQPKGTSKKMKGAGGSSGKKTLNTRREKELSERRGERVCYCCVKQGHG